MHYFIQTDEQASEEASMRGSRQAGKQAQFRFYASRVFHPFFLGIFALGLVAAAVPRTVPLSLSTAFPCSKRVVVLSAFPMFVPSLSW